jgi:hypothetical protein
MIENIKRNHVVWMFDWCKSRFGTSKFNNMFEVKVSRTDKSKYGCYLDDLDIIQVNLNAHKSLIELCDTVIHEYTHYLQNMYMYTQYFLKHNKSYNSHPYEISADNKAKKYRKELRAEFKKTFAKDLAS